MSCAVTREGNLGRSGTNLGCASAYTVWPKLRVVAHIGLTIVDREGGISSVIVDIPDDICSTACSVGRTEVAQHCVVGVIFSAQRIVDPYRQVLKCVIGSLCQREAPSSMIGGEVVPSSV